MTTKYKHVRKQKKLVFYASHEPMLQPRGNIHTKHKKERQHVNLPVGEGVFDVVGGGVDEDTSFVPGA
jgi:hypothetical protein